MAKPTPDDVALFLDQDDDLAVVGLAQQHLPVVTAMARSYTRGKGFVGDDPADDVAAVIITATARLMANPEQLRFQTGDVSYQSAFEGWTLAELFVLNRYRKRAQ